MCSTAEMIDRDQRPAAGADTLRRHTRSGRRTTNVWLGLGVSLLLASTGPARAAMSIIGGGMAEACSKAAMADKSDDRSIEFCNMALDTESLDSHDRAGTLINRGVMRLRRQELEPARADFDAAIAIAPKIGEAYVNRGAAYLAEKRYQAGLDDLNLALRLGVREPEKAYFNRALAFEGLDDEKSAYLDFQQALALKPGWLPPQRELTRFTLIRRQTHG